MRPGETCFVLDNSGKLHHAKLAEVSKSKAIAVIEREEEPQVEPRVKITVAQALPKTFEKLEWVLEHGVEAGVSEFIIFSSARSRPEASRFERKLDRWREIVKTAAEQSERVKLPLVQGICSLSDILALSAPYDLTLLAYEREKSLTLSAALHESHPASILVLIGPEGGFTDDEIDEARDAGVTLVSLGPRILRTETAALVMTAQIIYALDADPR
jgi:16S rRNA (uracil1498-N3)-methyltransferase